MLSLGGLLTNEIHVSLVSMTIFNRNVSVMSFAFVGFDVKLFEKPQKFCRGRQP